MSDDKVKEGEIVERKELPLVLADGVLTEADIKKAEAMVEGINKIKAISIKVTNYSDWSLQSGRPYLENSGCMKIAQLWGVNFKDREFKPAGGERIEDGKGVYIFFTCVGRAEFRGRTVEDIGTCSTRDDFFGTRKVEGDKQYKPLEDVDLENIKKKAVTNLQGRLLKKILGLNYTIEDLKAANIEIGKAASINYAGGGAGGGKISGPQGNRLHAILLKGATTDDERKARLDTLKLFMTKTYKTEHVKDIATKDYEAIVKQAEAIAGVPAAAAPAGA